MITSFNHNAFSVTDMDKALDFYVGAVGMKRSHEFQRDGKPWIVYLTIAGNDSLELFYDGVRDRDPMYSEAQIGYHHWCISCTDLLTLEKRIRAAGYISDDQHPVVTDEGGLNFWIHDPDGNALEILQYYPSERYDGRDELLGIHHVGIAVNDMPRALDFYVGQLGLTFWKHMDREDGSGKPWIEFLNVNGHQTLELFHGATEEVPNTWESAGSTHSCYNCPDIPETVEKLRAAGVPVIIEPNVGADGNLQAWVTDPEGRRVELMSCL
ncbi:hypothetical protein FACS1894208_03770 [Clostridia bacterium]|nr:hypothetical protein FACS1894208_03770 [Clostridia bacterium]